MNNAAKIATGMMCVALTLEGCVAITTGGGKKQPQPPTSTVRTVGGKVVLHPRAERDGDTVRVSLMATGTFIDETVEQRAYTTTPKRKVAIGILPGMASLDTDSVPGGTVEALWLNILLAGTPTLSGLLLEPFLPPIPDGRLSDGHFLFRRSALVGFHKYEVPGRSGRDAPKTARNEVEGSRPLEDVQWTFTASDEPAFWTRQRWKNGVLHLSEVQTGPHRGTMVIQSVGQQHPFRAELEKMLDYELTVDIPAE